ncbi:LysR family transcriptional regulator [Actinosynnema sp. ALI-1.44]|uniref:LysR family transcriptional regulator n=1 Tax=Actinosynnema sp. ALI-1.44 TaxID=1933779 RepID=UPI00097C13ED|nr:LysR family transcriptional regulator [Actinosynnema sp. ALI-1.44]ONI75246.1 LysR family transcriptional regulator [Actinosynnema sp. ALI-1.44]
MELELRHLRTVCAIAEAGSLTKAAAVLRMSQPALSARLNRLEQEIGATLFIRTAQGMTPTKVGDFVLLRARAILHGVDELARDAARLTNDSSSALALGGTIESVSVGLVERLGDSLSGIDVRLVMEYSPLLLWDLLVAGRLDVATLVDYPGYEQRSTPAVLCEVIVREPVFIALAESDPLSSLPEVPLAELAQRTWVMTPSDGAGWPDCFHAACGNEGFRPNVRYTTHSTDSIRTLVRTGRAVTACQPVYQPGEGAVVRPLAGNPLSMRHLIACPRNGNMAPRLPKLAALARDAYWAHVRATTPFHHQLRSP